MSSTVPCWVEFQALSNVIDSLEHKAMTKLRRKIMRFTTITSGLTEAGQKYKSSRPEAEENIKDAYSAGNTILRILKEQIITLQISLEFGVCLEVATQINDTLDILWPFLGYIALSRTFENDDHQSCPLTCYRNQQFFDEFHVLRDSLGHVFYYSRRVCEVRNTNGNSNPELEDPNLKTYYSHINHYVNIVTSKIHNLVPILDQPACKTWEREHKFLKKHADETINSIVECHRLIPDEPEFDLKWSRTNVLIVLQKLSRILTNRVFTLTNQMTHLGSRIPCEKRKILIDLLGPIIADKHLEKLWFWIDVQPNPPRHLVISTSHELLQCVDDILKILSSSLSSVNPLEYPYFIIRAIMLCTNWKRSFIVAMNHFIYLY